MSHLCSNAKVLSRVLVQFNCCNFGRKLSNASLNISESFTNRNPRNLERLRIGYKPNGYHLEKPGRNFWHKLKLSETGRYATASVVHFENSEILTVSTSEWALKKQLYKCKDVAAYTNLGRIFADRCLKSGIIEMECTIIPKNPDGRVASFLDEVQKGGVTLKEPPPYLPARPWDCERPEKPWEVTE